jgi:hypothetical protein
VDEDNKVIIDPIHLGEFDFIETRLIPNKKLQNRLRNLRHLRYTSFDGQKYEKNVLMVLYRKSIQKSERK